MRKKHSDEGGGESWLNTYADMVTLLLTFFAVLLSMSSVNQDKFNAFIRSFSGLPEEVVEEIVNSGVDNTEEGDVMLPAEFPADMNSLFEALSQYVQENNQEDAVSMSLVDDVIYIRFDSSIFFEPDQYILRPDSRPTLDFIGGALKQYEGSIKLVTIFGHTATVEGNSPVSDWMLSGERAAVVASYFQNEKGFDDRKMVVLGYGNNYPIADNTTQAGRRANRRVELAIIGTNSSNKFDPYQALEGLYNGMEYPKSGGATDILLPETSAKDPGVAKPESDEGGISPYEDPQP